MKRVKDESTIEDLFRMVTDRRLERLERLLKWLVIENLINDKDVDADFRAGVALNQPDISDIIAGKKK